MIKKNIKNDFPIFLNYVKKYPGKELLYLDNSATTLKPQVVIDAITKYYNSYSANVHRGDYKIAYKTDLLFKAARITIAEFINADFEELFFTSGATASVNQIVNMLEEQFHEGDEIITTYSEHSSLVAPLIALSNRRNLKMRYLKLDDNFRVNLKTVQAATNEKTKLIAIAQMTNTIGDIRPIKEICDFARKNKIMTLIDGTQSAPHMKVDVKDLMVDFFVFSAHKMLGPTGIGATYYNQKLFPKLKISNLGGGAVYQIKGDLITFKDSPYCFEAGTPNIAGIIGFATAVKYLTEIGMSSIWEHDQELKRYTIEQLTKLKKVKIYNPDNLSGIILFNVEKVFPQDVASQLSNEGICIRSGDHCAKTLPLIIKEKAYLRLSTYVYNTKSDIDKVVKAIANGGDFLDGFFTV